MSLTHYRAGTVQPAVYRGACGSGYDYPSTIALTDVPADVTCATCRFLLPEVAAHVTPAPFMAWQEVQPGVLRGTRAGTAVASVRLDRAAAGAESAYPWRANTLSLPLLSGLDRPDEADYEDADAARAAVEAYVRSWSLRFAA